MKQTIVSHTKPLSRMQRLSESRGGSKVTKPIFSNSRKLRLKALPLNIRKTSPEKDAIHTTHISPSLFTEACDKTRTWIGLIKHEKMQGVTGRTFIPA